MDTVSAVTGDHGGKIVFQHRGKTYYISHIKDPERKAFERWMHSQARQGIYALKGEMPDEEYAEMRDAVNAQIATGAFSWYGPLARKALTTEPGTIALAKILFGISSDEEMVGLYAERGDEINDILATIFTESTPDWAKVAKVKNGQAPGQTNPATTPTTAANPAATG